MEIDIQMITAVGVFIGPIIATVIAHYMYRRYATKQRVIDHCLQYSGTEWDKELNEVNEGINIENAADRLSSLGKDAKPALKGLLLSKDETTKAIANKALEKVNKKDCEVKNNTKNLYELSIAFYLCGIGAFMIWIYIQFFSSEMTAFSIALLGIISAFILISIGMLLIRVERIQGKIKK
ncbi:MAG: hypothetical protein WBD09_08835 [Halobacteriota archaeon]